MPYNCRRHLARFLSFPFDLSPLIRRQLRPAAGMLAKWDNYPLHKALAAKCLVIWIIKDAKFRKQMPSTIEVGPFKSPGVRAIFDRKPPFVTVSINCGEHGSENRRVDFYHGHYSALLSFFGRPRPRASRILSIESRL